MSTPARAVGVMGAAAIALALPVTVKWEGEKRVGYPDQLAGNLPTACFGHTKTAVIGRLYTHKQCVELLQRDMQEHGNAIRPCTPAATPIEVQGAILDLAFNAGPGAVCKSKLGAKLKAGDWRGACDQISRWVFVGKKDCRIAANKCRGIPLRRADERALCLSGL